MNIITIMQFKDPYTIFTKRKVLNKFARPEFTFLITKYKYPNIWSMDQISSFGEALSFHSYCDMYCRKYSSPFYRPVPHSKILSQNIIFQLWLYFISWNEPSILWNICSFPQKKIIWKFIDYHMTDLRKKWWVMNVMIMRDNITDAYHMMDSVK